MFSGYPSYLQLILVMEAGGLDVFEAITERHMLSFSLHFMKYRGANAREAGFDYLYPKYLAELTDFTYDWVVFKECLLMAMRVCSPEFERILVHSSAMATRVAFLEHLMDPYFGIDDPDQYDVFYHRIALPLFQKLQGVDFKEEALDYETGKLSLLSPFQSALRASFSFYSLKQLLKYWDIDEEAYMSILASQEKGWSLQALRKLFDYVYHPLRGFPVWMDCALCFSGERWGYRRLERADWALSVERIRLGEDPDEPLSERTVDLRLKWAYEVKRLVENQQDSMEQTWIKAICLACYKERAGLLGASADECLETSPGLLDIDF